MNESGKTTVQQDDVDHEFPFALFISYSSKDAVITVAGKKLQLLRELKRTLESHRTPERGRFRVCSFEEDFELQSTVAAAIREKLSESENLLIICSQASSQSPYIADELNVFSEIRSTQNIIPAQLDMLPEAAFPDHAFSSMGADLRIRPGDSVRDWRKRMLDESHKIVAKAWDLDLEDVYDRFHHQRRVRQGIALSAAVILLILIFSSGWLFWVNRKQQIHDEAARALESAGFSVADVTRENNKSSFGVTFEPSDDDFTTHFNENSNYVNSVQNAIQKTRDLLNVVSLSIQKVEVSDAWLETIAELGSLRELRIGESSITDSGLALLSQLDNLEQLELLQTQATDDGIPQLANLKHLKSLTLGSTSVTEEGRSKLKQLLPDCEMQLAPHEIAIPSIVRHLAEFGINSNHIDGLGFEVDSVSDESSAQQTDVDTGSLIIEINGDPVVENSQTILVANKLRAIQCAIRINGHDETMILGSTSSGLGNFTMVKGYEHDRFATQPSDVRLELITYTCSFDGPDDDNGDGKEDIWGIPQWVSFHIKAQDQRPAQRTGNYGSDSVLSRLGLISTRGRWRDDNRDFDRGHLCPSQTARRFGPLGNTEANLMINMCPQRQRFNRSTWLVLEELERRWADHFGDVWVICGPVVFNSTPSETIQDEGDIPVVVPDAFFRIIVRESEEGGLHVIPFVVPHTAEHRYPITDWLPFVTSVDVIEALTSLDFFTNIKIREDVVPDASWTTWLE